jgi:hypothetical protein
MNNQAFSWNPIIAGVKSMVEELKVRTYDASRQMAINLSGGNQQKVVFSKWVTRRLGVGRMDSGGFSLFLKGGGKLKNILDNSVFAVSNTRILGIPLVAYIFIGATRRYGAL